MHLEHGPKHKLCIRVDEAGLIEVRHRVLQDSLFLAPTELDELVDRAPEIRRHVREAWQAIHGQRGGEQ